VDGGGHRPPGRLGVPVRDRYGDLLVGAEDDLGLALAIVHERVVKPAVRGSRIQSDVLDSERLKQIDDDVGSVALLRRYLPTPRFSASATNESSIALVTSSVLTDGFVAASESRV